jgi:hypothetical protein
MPRNVTPLAQRQAVVDDYIARWQRGDRVRQEDHAALHGVHMQAFSVWLRRLYHGKKIWLRNHDAKRMETAQKRRAERRAEAEAVAEGAAQFWDSAGSLVALLGSIASQACADLAYGFHLGWVSEDTLVFSTPKSLTPEDFYKLHVSTKRPSPKEANEALAFLLGPEAEKVCDLINRLLGRERLSPDYLLQSARRMAHQLAHDGKIRRNPNQAN